MVANIESSVVICLDTSYHRVISKLQDCPLEIYEADNVSFANTSPTEIDDDTERKKRIAKVWRYTEIN